MEKITYLFGAGASAGCVPILAEIETYLNKMLIELRNWSNGEESEWFFTDFKTAHEVAKECDLRSDVQRLIEILEHLLDVSERHPSIDTYARKLHILRTKEAKEQLERFKSSLTVFISIIEAVRVSDKRYDLWLATLLRRSGVEDGLTLPNNVNVLSWNYDNQFEKVFAEYVPGHETMDDAQLIKEATYSLGIVEKHSQYRSVAKDHCNVVKLNGSAKFWFPEGSPRFEKQNPVLPNVRGISSGDLHKLIQLHQESCDPKFSKRHSLISFAWENDGKLDLEKDLNSILEPTTYLVIIGYSFPDFNRTIDLKLFSQMKNLKQIRIVEADKYFEVRKAAILAILQESGNPIVDPKNVLQRGLDKFPITSDMRAF